MSYYQERISTLIKRNNGLVLTSDLDKENLPRHHLSRFVAEKRLEREHLKRLVISEITGQRNP